MNSIERYRLWLIIIYLHHTAGSHRPDWVVASWERDKTGSGGVRHIATAYVIGGKWIVMIIYDMFIWK